MIILARSTNCIVHILITEKITFKTNKTHKMHWRGAAARRCCLSQREGNQQKLE